MVNFRIPITPKTFQSPISFNWCPIVWMPELFLISNILIDYLCQVNTCLYGQVHLFVIAHSSTKTNFFWFNLWNICWTNKKNCEILRLFQEIMQKNYCSQFCLFWKTFHMSVLVNHRSIFSTFPSCSFTWGKTRFVFLKRAFIVDVQNVSLIGTKSPQILFEMIMIFM